MKSLFKNVKGLKQKIFAIIMLIALLSLEFSPLSVNATDEQLRFSYKSIEQVGTDKATGRNIWYSVARLGGNIAYCIDYSCAAPNGVMTRSRKASDQALSVLLNGYPNSSPAQMGLDNEDEAYMATQWALWEIMNRTGESQKAGRIFRVDNVQPLASKAGFVNKTLEASKRLVNIAVSDPYTGHPVFEVNDKQAKLTTIGNDALIGPYIFNVSGVYNASCIKGLYASLVNAPSSARITDANGNAKTSVSNGDSVYIRMSANENSTSFKLHCRADVDRKVGYIYSQSGYVQDYIIIDSEPETLEGDIPITWNRVNTDGEIKIVKVDQENQPVVGAKFRLQRPDGSTVIEASTGKDGVLKFSNVPEGNYVLVEVEAPAGYVIKEKTKNVTVKRDETTTVNVVNDRITGKLVITKIDDLNRPLAGVKFEIYNSGRYLIDTITTDASGKASIDVDYGTYYFREVYAPEGYIMDQTLYKFSVDEENRTFYKTITNEVYKGTIIITKVDDENKPISGVSFEITDANGNLVNTITTNSTGKCGLQNLPIGTYYYQEKSVPEGYIKDTEKHEFVLSQNKQVIEKTVVNKKIKGKIEINKINAEKEPVANVTFNILNEEKEIVDTIITDEKGQAASKELELGTYYYQETKVPDSYILDSNMYEFKLTNDAYIIKKTVVNYQMKGSLKITKYTDKGVTLAGVKFEILDKNKNVVDTIITNENGIANSKLLPIGEYTYREVSAPDNVVMDKSEHAFVLNQNNQVVSKTVINDTIEGKLHIIKVDENNKPLEGVVFNILDLNKNVVDTITTNADGVAKSKDLEKGTYYYQEIKAPEGLMIDNNYYEFTIEYNGQNVIKNMVNYYAKGNLKITKIDNYINKLSGVKFEIMDSNGYVVDTITTNENGEAFSKNLPLGKYTYKEVEAPEGVIMDDATYSFSLTENNQVVSREVINEVIEAKLRIIKVDENKKPLAGVKFRILDEDGNLIDTIITNDDGIAESKELTLGTYYYQEIEAPQGIVVDSTLYEFTIEYDGQNVVKNMINFYEKGKLKIQKYDSNKYVLKDVKFEITNAEGVVVDTIVTNDKGIAESKKLPLGTYYYQEIEAPDYVVIDNNKYKFELSKNNEVITKEVINEIAEGKLKIIKVDENNLPLAGVKFNILDLQKEVIDTIVTNDKGIAESKKLEKGTYYYQEIEAPEGIIVDEKMYEFTIEYDGQNVIQNMVNYYAKGSLKVIKCDSKNRVIEGVKFEITDNSGMVVDTITTNSEGIAETKKLPLGTYYYQEIEAPDNVVMSTEKKEFSIMFNNQVVTKTVVNKLVEGKLTIIKVDENEVPLEGVKFEITDKNGNVVDTIITDKDGVAVSKEIEKGTYYYQEIEAPEGIIIDTNKYEFVVESDGQNVIKNMINYYAKGKLQITKLVEKTNATLAGVTFEVYDDKGQTVDMITTDENGIATTKSLPVGQYFFREVSAPQGYIMDNRQYEFSIITNNDLVQAIVYNKIEELPVTGGKLGSNTRVILLVTVISSMIYAVSILLRKRED